MKKLCGKIQVLSVLVMMIILMVGCEKSKKISQEQSNYAVIVGRHANASKPALNDVKSYINEACDSYGFVSLIALDGEPFMMEGYNIPEIKKKLTEDKLKKILKSYSSQIVTEANNCIAKTPEVDIMAAFDIAQKSLDSKEGEKTIVIMSSGISTQGVVDFRNSMLQDIEPQKVVESLKENDELINLQSIDRVVWIGIGNVVEPQKSLSTHNVNVLKDVWEAILTAAGTEVEFIMNVPNNQLEEEVLPEVSVVEVLEPANAIGDENFDEATGIEFREEDLKFKPDSAELVTSEELAINKLSNIIRYLQENKDDKVLICGTTASVGELEDAILLSQKRADAIKNLIVSQGVNKDQIDTIGLGYQEHPFHQNDLEEGILIEEIAKKNRKVIVLHRDSKTAQSLIDEYSYK